MTDPVDPLFHAAGSYALEPPLLELLRKSMCTCTAAGRRCGCGDSARLLRLLHDGVLRYRQRMQRVECLLEESYERPR
jgi:hypothetical protein